MPDRHNYLQMTVRIGCERLLFFIKQAKIKYTFSLSTLQLETLIKIQTNWSPFVTITRLMTKKYFDDESEQEGYQIYHKNVTVTENRALKNW
jgi:hypothetical protein